MQKLTLMAEFRALFLPFVCHGSSTWSD